MDKKEIPVMDKLVRNIIIAVVVVLLLIAGYIAVSVIPGQINDINIEEKKAETGDIVIMSTAVNYVNSVTVTNETGTYTFKRDNSDMWTIAEHSDLLFENVSLESAVYGLSNLNALDEVEVPEDLSDYGLDKPRVQFEVALKNGSVRKFALGKRVTGGTGDFFMDVTNNKIYVISVYMADTMTKGVNGYRKTKIASITSNELTKLVITNPNGKIVMEMGESHYSENLVFKMTHPKHMELDETIVNPILEKIQDINVIEYVEDKSTDLSKYGLSNPKVTVEMSAANKSYTLKFGNKTDNGTIYTMIDGMDFVFTYSPALYNSCENVTAYNLMNKFVNIVNISEVKSITVEGKNKKHILEIEGGNAFYVDGKTANAESFRKTYQSVIGIKGSGLAENNIVSPAEYIVEFVYKNGETSKIVYASYNDMNYYVEINGERGFITLKKGLDDMMAVVEKLAKDPAAKID